MNDLVELRQRIERTAPNLGRFPCSQKIVRMTLHEINRQHGREAASQVVRDFDLERQGFIPE